MMMTEQSSDQAATLLHRVLCTLDQWRHLPAYQLERRMDVFIGLYLPEIVEAEFGWPRESLCVIPEFPLHKGLVLGSRRKNGKSDNQSIKVDYAVFCGDQKNKRLLLVEFKTDNKSIDLDQLKRMEKTNSIKARELLKGVVQCACHSKELRKYAHLISRLDEADCINVPEGFDKWT